VPRTEPPLQQALARFMARTPHGYHDRGTIAHDVAPPACATRRPSITLGVLLAAKCLGQPRGILVGKEMFLHPGAAGGSEAGAQG
jgi:hypothetical protein